MSQVKVFLLVLAFFLITNLSYGKNIDLSGLEGSVEEPELSAVLDALDKFLASKPEKNLSAQYPCKIQAVSYLPPGRNNTAKNFYPLQNSGNKTKPFSTPFFRLFKTQFPGRLVFRKCFESKRLLL